jgi:Protein of unknown function DUF2625
MRKIDELVSVDEPAMPLVRQWLAESCHPIEVLQPNKNCGDVLVSLQITTRSPMGAIAYETGGILIDHGWLRLLGSGNPKLPRSIVDWNAGRSSGYLLFADDAVGGFFAINGGALGSDQGVVYYWAPDTLNWESLGLGYSDFLCWALSDRLNAFYESLRWPGWEESTQQLAGDQCFTFYPFLWSKQGSVESSSRKAISVAEQFLFNTDCLKEARLQT